jgi:hypothetical protein
MTGSARPQGFFDGIINPWDSINPEPPTSGRDRAKVNEAVRDGLATKE